MLDIFTGIEKWINSGKKFAIATVISTWGSGPRKKGEAMAISENGKVLGSVSGGCVEATVIAEALAVLKENSPKQRQFRITHADAWEVGLSCGGKLELFIEPFFLFNEESGGKLIWQELHDLVQNNHGAVLLTKMTKDEGRHTLIRPDGSTLGSEISDALKEQTLLAFTQRTNQLLEEDGIHYFALNFPRRSELLVIGAAHMAAELVELASQFDFKTIVIEPRGFFTNKIKFPKPPDELHEKWPQDVLPGLIFDQNTYAVTLSHDPKIDDPALQILLRSNVGYIGCLGSRRTHESRKERLAKAGFTEEQIARVHGPVGVNINAQSAKEIALSIMAEIIAVKNYYL